MHKSFEDPAAAVGSEEEKLNVFSQVRDEIKDWTSKTFENDVNFLIYLHGIIPVRSLIAFTIPADWQGIQ